MWLITSQFVNPASSIVAKPTDAGPLVSPARVTVMFTRPSPSLTGKLDELNWIVDADEVAPVKFAAAVPLRQLELETKAMARGLKENPGLEGVNLTLF